MIVRRYGERVAVLEGWSDDAVKAMTENPNYWLGWYSVKSIALVLAFGAFTYMLGRQAGR